MANTTLFQTIRGKLTSQADTKNRAGGTAYLMSDEQVLAQYVSTGCLNGTYYADASEQLDTIVKLTSTISSEMIAKTAIHCREKGYMKDMPALLCAILAVKDSVMLERIFGRVIDNGKMLRTFVQMVRSGRVGRKSFGSAPKRMIREWFATRSNETIFKQSIGNSPSMLDVIKMVHPKPVNSQQEALFGYLLNKEHDATELPTVIREFEAFKKDPTLAVPAVPFQMLTALNLTVDHWKQIAEHGSWQMIRMNLNTFARHGVLKDVGTVKRIAERLKDHAEIAKARVFPYQIMAAYLNCSGEIPAEIRDSLHDAMELAVGNIPEFSGKIYVCVDVSGSMQTPVTGHRAGATTKIRCIDVAGLIAASILRKNRSAEVIPFSDDVVSVTLEPRDTIMSNAKKLASLPSGGTCCSAPVAYLNRKKAKGDLIIMVSDNESWRETIVGKNQGATRTMKEWEIFKSRNEHARFISIDLQPGATSQVQERSDILNVGGFSDAVFETAFQFASGTTADHWTDQIRSVKI